MFNKNLKDIRLQQGLTQKQVADYLMVSAQSISKWEKGEALPSIEYLPKLAECLNCDINAFFKPIQKKELNVSLICSLLEMSYGYIYNQKEVDEEFNAFFIKNPDVLELLTDFEKELKQYQIIKVKTLASRLDCTEDCASAIMELCIKHDFVEKLANEDSYFVFRDNIGGLRIVLNLMLDVCRVKFR